MDLGAEPFRKPQVVAVERVLRAAAAAGHARAAEVAAVAERPGAATTAVLAAATPEFAQSLNELTTLQIAQFAKKVTAEMAETTKVVSNEYIGDETAEMLVLKGDADLILRFRRDGQRWRLDDLAVRYRREGDDIASARLVSAAMGAALKFESAFRNSDKRVLSQVCTPSFFEGSLAPSDLTQVHLLETGPGLDDFDLKLDNARATFVVRSGSEELTISLKQQDIDIPQISVKTH